MLKVPYTYKIVLLFSLHILMIAVCFLFNFVYWAKCTATVTLYINLRFPKLASVLLYVTRN